MNYSERNSLSSAAPISFHSRSSSLSIISKSSTESCELSPKSRSSGKLSPLLKRVTGSSSSSNVSSLSLDE